jgi:hypothetical protein
MKIVLEIHWARGTFRDLLLAADKLFMKMGKTNVEHRDLMHQMR